MSNFHTVKHPDQNCKIQSALAGVYQGTNPPSTQKHPLLLFLGSYFLRPPLTRFLHCSLILPVVGFHRNGIVWDVLFCVWLPLLIVVYFRSIHFLACFSKLFVFMAE